MTGRVSHNIDNENYITKLQDSINIKINDLIKPQNDFNAVLITIYNLDEVFDYSANYPSGDSYSIIKMFLFDKSGVLIRKRLFSALSADRYGFKIDPINKVLSQQQCYLHIL
ncbi:MAG: hypothetical protein A2X08_00505 [Bacteroidetes bacterium GWA2_32_17]|nr:MAG: hypothetical protein A2X08_00505 [Bacteroidetes bacterium GWA2_32_17]